RKRRSCVFIPRSIASRSIIQGTLARGDPERMRGCASDLRRWPGPPHHGAMRSCLAILFLPLLVACRAPAPPTVDPASRRTTPSGEVVGFVGRYGSHVWRGLPYAAPPVGDLRWR